MNKEAMLEQLDKATDRATDLAIQRGSPITLSEKSVLVGNAFIQKNSSGYYNVLSWTKEVLYEDITVFDVALIVAQRYSAGELGVVKQVLDLEEKFSKHHTDMVHYLNCMKGAKKKQDKERMAILEDKFQISESRAKSVRNQITTFKRLK